MPAHPQLLWEIWETTLTINGNLAVLSLADSTGVAAWEIAEEDFHKVATGALKAALAAGSAAADSGRAAGGAILAAETGEAADFHKAALVATEDLEARAATAMEGLAGNSRLTGSVFLSALAQALGNPSARATICLCKQSARLMI
jgi:hypothetical protein